MQISILHAYILRHLKISAIGNKSGLGKPPPSDTLKSEGLFGSVWGIKFMLDNNRDDVSFCIQPDI